jgi:hypothetical protein
MEKERRHVSHNSPLPPSAGDGKEKKKGRKGRTSIVHQQVQLVLKVKDLVLLKDRTPRGRAESGELVSAGVEHAVNVVELSFDEERCK